jgi:hypothetical protein
VPDYDSPADNGLDNFYDLQIEATDSEGDTATRSLTVQVLEVATTGAITAGGSMANLTTAFGKLYYRYAISGDEELWEYDPNNGISGTAQQVAEINPGGSSAPTQGTPSRKLFEYKADSGALYFTAHDGGNDYVYRYDGTTYSTNNDSSVTKITSLSTSIWDEFLFRNPIEFDDKLYFINADDNQSNSELIEWDGSNPRDIATKTSWTASPVGPFGSSDGETLYTGAISYSSNKGSELYYWKTSDAPQVLTHAASFNLGSLGNDPSGSNGYPQFMIEYDGSLFLRASSVSDAKNYELWEFNLTENTKTEYEIGSTTDHNGLAYAPMIVFKDKLYMIGDDNQTNTGKELFVFDGPGTRTPELVLNINQGAGAGLLPTPAKWEPTIFNDKLYFIADDGSGSDLWVYDGISDPTKAYNFTTTSKTHLTSLTVLDDKLFFLGENTFGDIDLWSIG